MQIRLFVAIRGASIQAEAIIRGNKKNFIEKQNQFERIWIENAFRNFFKKLVSFGTFEEISIYFGVGYQREQEGRINLSRMLSNPEM